MKNRLIRSATWEGIAEFDGSISPEAYEIYSELANGGIGAVIVGFTDVSQDDFYIHGMMRLSRDELIPQYKKLTDIIQLAMGAFYRKLANGLVNQVEADDMTSEEIEHVIFLFVKDIYGQRSLIVTEILDGIKREIPELHVSIKINCSDFTLGGLDEYQSLEICKILSEHGIDSIEVSGNGTSVPGIKAHVNEAYFLNFAAALAEKVSVPVILVGGLRSLETMQNILDTTKIELLSFAIILTLIGVYSDERLQT